MIGQCLWIIQVEGNVRCPKDALEGGGLCAYHEHQKKAEQAERARLAKEALILGVQGVMSEPYKTASDVPDFLTSTREAIEKALSSTWRPILQKYLDAEKG